MESGPIPIWHTSYIQFGFCWIDPHLRSHALTFVFLTSKSHPINSIHVLPFLIVHYRFRDHKPAVGAYKRILQPPTSKCDVTYWLNYLSEQRANNTTNNQTKKRTAAINTAVEATTLNERTYKPRPQDLFLRDNISAQDTLIVSIGGNDVAMMPAPCTVLAMAGLLALPMGCVRSGMTCGTVPVDDCCCGCGPSTVSCLGSVPPCLGYFRHLFGTR